MKCLLVLFFILATPVVTASPSVQSCGQFSTTTDVSAPLTIAEIEREEMSLLAENLKIRSDYPKVPFGFMHAKWVAFKSLVRPGDKIVRYTSSAHSWQHLAGEAGYGLIRSGCLIKTFTTMVN